MLTIHRYSCRKMVSLIEYCIESLFTYHHSDADSIDWLALDEKKNISFQFTSIDDIDNFDIFRSVIRSAAAMTYEQGHNLIYDGKPNKSKDIFPPIGQAGQPIHEGYCLLFSI